MRLYFENSLKKSRIILICFITLLISCAESNKKITDASSAPTLFNQEIQSLPGFENPPVFESSKILQPTEVVGKNYKISDPVKNDGWMNHYEIISKYGSFYAGSTDVMKQRLSEVIALDALYEYSQGGVFLSSAGETGKDILLSPIKTASNIVNAVSDPEGTWNKVAGIPDGISRLWGSISRSVSSGSKKILQNANQGNENEPYHELSSEDVDRIAKFAMKQYGFNLSKSEREWYRKLGIDPYTDNQVLRDRIARLASIQSTVKFSSRFVPGIVSLGFIGSANRYLNLADKISLYEDSSQIAEKNMDSLRQMDIGEKAISDFYSNQYLTPTFQSIIVESLKLLNGVKDREEYISLCSSSTSREDSWFFVKTALQLAAIHNNESKLSEIVIKQRLPAGVKGDGTIVIILPVDFLIWSSDFSIIINSFESIKKLNKSLLELRVQGLTSNRVKLELENKGIKLKEKQILKEIKRGEDAL